MPDPFQLLFPEATLPVAQDSGITAFARKVSHHVCLSESDHADLAAILARNVRAVAGRRPVAEDAAGSVEINIMLEGWACRYKTLGSGRRQIVAIYLPGDVCNFDALLMAGPDQSIRAARGACLAGICHATLDHVVRTMPAISHGLWWESVASASIQRVWTVNVSRRSATKRLAHLLCELFTRLTAIGLNQGWRCAVPLTQADLGQACGLTPVHTNRTIQELRLLGLIALEGGMLEILDWDAMRMLADFDPDYLHLKRSIVATSEQEQPRLHPVFMPPATPATPQADHD